MEVELTVGVRRDGRRDEAVALDERLDALELVAHDHYFKMALVLAPAVRLVEDLQMCGREGFC